jgi:integrase
MRIEQKLSAWTIHKDASALAKLYQCSYLDFGVKLPRRERKNRVKNRTNPLVNDPEYESVVHAICEFCAATGLRRHELLALRGDDIILDKYGNPAILVRQGKGGKRRYVHPLNSFPFQLFLDALNNGARHRKLFDHIPSRIPTHFLRGEFARKLYSQYARPLDQIPPEDQYHCRKDMKDVILDKRAMHRVSKELGHNRICVVTLYLI